MEFASYLGEQHVIVEKGRRELNQGPHQPPWKEENVAPSEANVHTGTHRKVSLVCRSLECDILRGR